MWTEEELNYIRKLTEGSISNHWTRWAKEMSEVFGEQRTADQVRGQWRLNIRNTKGNHEPKYKEAVEILSNGNVKSDKLIELSLEQSKDPQYILEAHGFDPKEFELTNAKSSQWNHSNKEHGTSVMYSSKITVKPIEEEELSQEELISEFAKSVAPHETKTVNRGNRNLVIPLADLHWGVTKLEMTEDKLDEIVGVISKGYKTIVIEQLGDLFHSSQMRSSQTLRGTFLNDVDMVQAVDDAKGFYHVIIESALQNAGEVIVEHASGNHSGNMEYMFLVYLDAKYPELKVNLHNDFRRAYRLDNVGILLTHGDTAKKKLPMLFANEYKEIWSGSESLEIHTGHFHTQEKDIDGVTHRQMGTVKPSDLYEIEHGWTTGKKVIQLIEYSPGRAKAIYEI